MQDTTTLNSLKSIDKEVDKAKDLAELSTQVDLLSELLPFVKSSKNHELRHKVQDIMRKVSFNPLYKEHSGLKPSLWHAIHSFLSWNKRL